VQLRVVAGGNTGGAEISIVMLDRSGNREVAHLSVSGGVSDQVVRFPLGSRQFRADVTGTGRALRFQATLNTYSPG
jgi:hypothetical protein